jgi:uncharacterized protein (DUF885 family)
MVGAVSSPGAYDAFVSAFHDLETRDANECVFKGVGTRLGDLPDPSADEAARTVAEARRLLASIDGIERAGLDADARLDLDLARLVMERQVHEATIEIDGIRHAARLPRAGRTVGDGIFLLFADDPRPAGERLADITSRLEQVPAFADAMLARLDRPVARWVDIDVEDAEGLPDLFGAVDAWAEAEGWADRPRLRAARAAAEDALRGYARRLRALPTSTSVHVGTPAARLTVKLRGLEPSLEELHAMATGFLAETASTLEALRGRLTGKYRLDPATSVIDLDAFLRDRFRVDLGGDLDRLPARYEAERDKLAAFIAERDLFEVPADQELRILRTPKFMIPTIPAGAMMPPPPFRPGVRRSLVYITVDADRVGDHTELDIPSMMLHEGIPGHHLQLAHAAGHRSVIRRHVDAPDQAEGWTTMLEDYMLDQGYMGELGDEARFIGKRDLARIGARVAIDLFFMTGDRAYLDVGVDYDRSAPDAFAAAGALLAAVTGFSPARASGELNWYSQERGYPLSYLTGNRLVWRLKGDFAAAARARGERDPLAIDRAFHRAYLAAGNMPVSFLRRAMAAEL